MRSLAIFILAILGIQDVFARENCAQMQQSFFASRCDGALNSHPSSPCQGLRFEGMQSCLRRYDACLDLQGKMRAMTCGSTPAQAPARSPTVATPPPTLRRMQTTIPSVHVDSAPLQPVGQFDGGASVNLPPVPPLSPPVTHAINQSEGHREVIKNLDQAQGSISGQGELFREGLLGMKNEPRQAVSSARLNLDAWARDLTGRGLGPGSQEYSRYTHDRTLLERAEDYLRDPKNRPQLSEQDVRSANNDSVRRELFLIHDIKENEPEVLDNARRLLEAASLIRKKQKEAGESEKSMSSLEALVSEAEDGSGVSHGRNSAEGKKDSGSNIGISEEGKGPPSAEEKKAAALKRAELRKRLNASRGGDGKYKLGIEEGGEGALTEGLEGFGDDSGSRSAGEGLVGALTREASARFAMANSETEAEVKRILAQQAQQQDELAGILVAESSSLFKRVNEAHKECVVRRCVSLIPDKNNTAISASNQN